MDGSTADALFNSPPSTLAMVMFVIVAIGLIVTLVGGIMVLIAAFRESIWWGLGFFVPCVGGLISLIFVIMHWSQAKKGFLIQLAGLAVALGAGVVVEREATKAAAEAMAEADRQAALARLEEMDDKLEARAVRDEIISEAEAAGLEAAEGGAVTPGSATPGSAGPEATVPGGVEPPPGARRPSSAASSRPSGNRPQASSGRRSGPRRVIAPTVGPQPRQPEAHYQVVDPSQASSYVGRIAEVITIEEQSQRGYIREIRDGRLYLESNVGGGSLTFPIVLRRIKELRVFL